MNFPLNKQKALKALFILIFVLLLSYFAWDMSKKVRDSFVSQGYDIAMNEIITTAENQQCQPFRIFLNEKSVHLINVECLGQLQGEPEMISPEIQE